MRPVVILYRKRAKSSVDWWMYLCGGFVRRAAGNDEREHFPCALSRGMAKAGEAGHILSPEIGGGEMFFSSLCKKFV